MNWLWSVLTWTHHDTWGQHNNKLLRASCKSNRGICLFSTHERGVDANITPDQVVASCR